MDITPYLLRRYTTKAFDPERRLDAAQLAQIETLLRYSPSSTNAQPWHFILAGSDEGKARIAQATQGFYSFNDAKIRRASHVVVLCTRAQIDDSHLLQVLAQEDQDGRFANAEAREGQHRGRSHFVNAHRFQLRDSVHWMEKQVYLALGMLLLGVAAMEIDACPIEGFDAVALDEALGLRQHGLVPSVIVALGYSAADDFNAALPKSRLPADSVITRL